MEFGAGGVGLVSFFFFFNRLLKWLVTLKCLSFTLSDFLCDCGDSEVHFFGWAFWCTFFSLQPSKTRPSRSHWSLVEFRLRRVSRVFFFCCKDSEMDHGLLKTKDSGEPWPFEHLLKSVLSGWTVDYLMASWRTWKEERFFFVKKGPRLFYPDLGGSRRSTKLLCFLEKKKLTGKHTRKPAFSFFPRSFGARPKKPPNHYHSASTKRSQGVARWPTTRTCGSWRCRNDRPWRSKRRWGWGEKKGVGSWGEVFFGGRLRFSKSFFVCW